MAAIERVEAQLKSAGSSAYRVTDRRITVDPSTAAGFTVSLTEGNGEFVVDFDGWHESFASEDEAIACFAFGLTDKCRLRVHYRGLTAYRWAVEARTGDDWQEDSMTSLLLFPFWRPSRVEYRQNAVVDCGLL